MSRDRKFLFRTHLAAFAIAGLVLTGCTSSGEEASKESEAPSEQTESTEATDEADTETPLGEEPNPPARPIGDDFDGATDDELVFADEEGISEEVAEAPVIAEDDPVEADLELTPEVPQADLEVSEAAICATVQIGHDATVDGDETVATAQRDLLVERAGGVADDKLSAILEAVSSAAALDGAVMEDALARCVELGFER